ncbi:MAG: RICIN domain-containing protein [Pseudomonadota bacterium]
MRNLVILSALIAIGSASHAAPPEVPSEAPYIVLSDNLDEPNGYGFCLDTSGPGRSDLMQTHSCKPAAEGEPRDYAGNDTRFLYDAATGRIASYAFEGMCLQVLRARDETAFGLLECSDHPRQEIIYESGDQTLRLGEDPDLCLGVAPETVPAGPWVKRSLVLERCDRLEDALKQWTVVSQ